MDSRDRLRALLDGLKRGHAPYEADNGNYEECPAVNRVVADAASSPLDLVAVAAINAECPCQCGADEHNARVEELRRTVLADLDAAAVREAALMEALREKIDDCCGVEPLPARDEPCPNCKAARAALANPSAAARALLDEIAAAKGRAERAEAELRREWWLNHGHPDSCTLYGDDGEMQCAECGDFKREPLESLRATVASRRLLAAIDATRTPAGNGGTK